KTFSATMLQGNPQQNEKILPSSQVPSSSPEERMEDVREIHGSILREREDPRDGYEPIPLWLVTFIMIVVFWGGLYLAYFSGNFRSDVFDPSTLLAASSPKKESGPPDPLIVGKRVFQQNCAVCHQTTGLGVPGQFPPLAGSEWVLSQDWHGDNHLVKIVLKGLQGVVQVKGNTYNNAMPAQEKLSDEQLAAVLTYIRNEWGNKAPPIPPEFVARIRAEIKDRTQPWTQDELKAIPRELVAPEQAPESTPANPTPPPPEPSPLPQALQKA
ncbi:MAG: cytochrome c, partial [Chthoniobacterales bacterium]|nr:cytochrome c [Chthoniobacterales bacterium]